MDPVDLNDLPADFFMPPAQAAEVDVTLIDEMLTMNMTERLEYAQEAARSILELTGGQARS
jgi:nicotinate-nucleotide pyrophosphorylase